MSKLERGSALLALLGLLLLGAVPVRAQSPTPGPSQPRNGAGNDPPALCNPCLFYGGNFDGVDALSNEMNTLVSSSIVYDNATVAPEGWIVTGIFTNNLVTDANIFPTGHWEIRSGVSQGNGGTLVAFGDGPVTVTPNGQDGFHLTGVFVLCSVPNVSLTGSTTYWFSCTPRDNGSGRSFESSTSDSGELGAHIENCPPNDPGCAFWTSPFFGFFFDKTTHDSSDFKEFSFGVIGNVGSLVLAVDFYANANIAGAADGTLRLLNDGNASDASPAGDLCAAIYVFDDNENQQECCSCRVTPNGYLSLSINSNLTANNAPNKTLHRGVIKILSSAPSGGVCDPTTANTHTHKGIHGWLTHIEKVGAGFDHSTEDLKDSTASLSEAGHLAEGCSLIRSAGHGVTGVCSCADAGR
jgi:hypothetical protein